MNQQLVDLLATARTVVVLQADNPDGDSLGSSLALEQILGDMGKTPLMFCGVSMPAHLRHLPGWDRVSDELPRQFDLSIIVDTSAISLFESLQRSGGLPLVASKPSLVLDHHDVEPSIPFATLVINQPAVATGELIYELAQAHGWPLNLAAREMIATSIMSDSLGLVSEGTTPRSIHIIAELVESGVSLAALADARRQTMRRHRSLLSYKGQLLQRVELHADDQIATVDIPWPEIEQYSPLYNPSMLVLDDMRMVDKTRLAIAFKLYQDGKVTAKIRANYGDGVAGRLAEQFGGGGHPYASGFKVTGITDFAKLKGQVIDLAAALLTEHDKDVAVGGTGEAV